MHGSPAHHLPNGGENLKTRARVGHASSVADMQREWDNNGAQVSSLTDITDITYSVWMIL